jgi:GNAT superfamily N-acetyltransferase
VNEDKRIEKLRSDHPVEDFDSGRVELNRYLQRFAWQNQQAGAAQTYVGVVGESLVGYYTLAVGHVTLEDAPERLKKGLAKRPIPIMLLARLAVDLRWQGQGVGRALLRDAMQRTVQAADIAGIRAFAVHAKDDEASRFYEHFDFIQSPADPMHLFVLLKDVRRIIAGRSHCCLDKKLGSSASGEMLSASRTASATASRVPLTSFGGFDRNPL